MYTYILVIHLQFTLHFLNIYLQFTYTLTLNLILGLHNCFVLVKYETSTKILSAELIYKSASR